MLAKLFKASGLIAILTFPLAAIATRMDLIHFRTGFDLVGYSVMLAIAVFLIGTIVGFAKSKSAPELAKAARFASMLALVPILIFGNQLIKTRTLPPIHNISTDVQDPPSFDKVIELRGEDTNPLAYPAENIEAQQAAYPDIKTLTLAKPADEVFASALELVEARGWELVSQNPEAGIIEATETTFVWGFKDDVVIRIRAEQDNSLVDVRSVSRVGQSDIGANAKRIEGILADLSR